MILNKITLTHTQLSLFPENARTFFLLAGHILNELNSLNKIFSWCLHYNPEDDESDVERFADGVQAMIIARILAGKLLEGWGAVRVGWYGTRLSQEVERYLPEESLNALQNIKSYFNNTNSLKYIRNNLAFHYSSDAFKESFDDFDSGSNFLTILGGTVGNNLYKGSELTANLHLLQRINPLDHGAALETILNDVQANVRDFIDFLEGAILVIMERNLPEPFQSYSVQEEIAPSIGWDEVRIPFFVNPSDKTYNHEGL